MIRSLTFRARDLWSWLHFDYVALQRSVALGCLGERRRNGTDGNDVGGETVFAMQHQPQQEYEKKHRRAAVFTHFVPPSEERAALYKDIAEMLRSSDYRPDGNSACSFPADGIRIVHKMKRIRPDWPIGDAMTLFRRHR